MLLQRGRKPAGKVRLVLKEAGGQGNTWCTTGKPPLTTHRWASSTLMWMAAVLHADFFKTPSSHLSLQGWDKLPHVGVWVIALHWVQLVAVVPSSNGINMAAQHADTVVGMLLLQRLDGAPAVVTRVVSGKNKQEKEQRNKNLTFKIQSAGRKPALKSAER